MPQPRPKDSARHGWWRWTLIGLLVVAVAVAGVGAWFGFGSDLLARSRAREAMSRFAAGPAQAPAESAQARPGQVIGVITIPRLGLTWPVVAGTDRLGRGLGWNPGTTWPGEPGNAVLAGLRLTGGSPLRHFPDLRTGDRIVLRMSDGSGALRTLTYVVKVAPAQLTVDRDDTWVMDAVPGHPSAVPTESLLTLVSSQDLLATRERSVAFAVLQPSA
ncbi:class E sortase [Aestuariimicrobium soli]|uniref:class E sortase n=1 Tax=Aestuariimicrobium soli TaxID=2035834 RepID=UPI003EBF92B5